MTLSHDRERLGGAGYELPSTEWGVPRINRQKELKLVEKVWPAAEQREGKRPKPTERSPREHPSVKQLRNRGIFGEKKE